jgi:hypothetical protein
VLVGGFHDEVHMVALKRVMNEPKTESVAPAFEGSLQREQRAAAAQVPAAVSDSQRGMDRMVPRELGTREVGDAALAAALSPGARTKAAPGLRLQRQWKLGGAQHEYDCSSKLWMAQNDLFARMTR